MLVMHQALGSVSSQDFRNMILVMLKDAWNNQNFADEKAGLETLRDLPRGREGMCCLSGVC